jgi:DNA-binding response OmpR family regulator
VRQHPKQTGSRRLQRRRSNTSAAPNHQLQSQFDGITASKSECPTELCVGGIRVDQAARVAYRHGRALRLTPADLRLLEFLMLNHHKVFSRRQLLVHMAIDLNNLSKEILIDVQISRIRAAINRGKDFDPIRTVRGYGYSFDETCEALVKRMRPVQSARRIDDSFHGVPFSDRGSGR